MKNYFNKLTEIRGVLALIIMTSCITMLFSAMIIYGKEKEVLLFILGQIATIIGGIIGYYFGSSYKGQLKNDNTENTSLSNS